ncbi:MDS1 and EVI1 complex locus protein EVI1 [Porphyridium purpureum]|uniref:MDS1 and EVI1 complex locus protein EVI1 n=1 Tax=Porphyridium purpureum TaxID=35688 RepID=A0A5J4YLB4_PORPP|nr:MDS1 and EVI1 complex locus protein EVI1 [Porphyridium purpureum]|eukprot:POR5891..scf291_13
MEDAVLLVRAMLKKASVKAWLQHAHEERLYTAAEEETMAHLETGKSAAGAVMFGPGQNAQIQDEASRAGGSVHGRRRDRKAGGHVFHEVGVYCVLRNNPGAEPLDAHGRRKETLRDMAVYQCVGTVFSACVAESLEDEEKSAEQFRYLFDSYQAPESSMRGRSFIGLTPNAALSYWSVQGCLHWREISLLIAIHRPDLQLSFASLHTKVVVLSEKNATGGLRVAARRCFCQLHAQQNAATRGDSNADIEQRKPRPRDAESREMTFSGSQPTDTGSGFRDTLSVTNIQSGSGTRSPLPSQDRVGCVEFMPLQDGSLVVGVASASGTYKETHVFLLESEPGEKDDVSLPSRMVGHLEFTSELGESQARLHRDFSASAERAPLKSFVRTTSRGGSVEGHGMHEFDVGGELASSSQSSIPEISVLDTFRRSIGGLWLTTVRLRDREVSLTEFISTESFCAEPGSVELPVEAVSKADLKTNFWGHTTRQNSSVHDDPSPDAEDCDAKRQKRLQDRASASRLAASPKQTASFAGSAANPPVNGASTRAPRAASGSAAKSELFTGLTIGGRAVSMDPSRKPVDIVGDEREPKEAGNSRTKSNNPWNLAASADHDFQAAHQLHQQTGSPGLMENTLFQVGVPMSVSRAFAPLDEAPTSPRLANSVAAPPASDPALHFSIRQHQFNTPGTQTNTASQPVPPSGASVSVYPRFSGDGNESEFVFMQGSGMYGIPYPQDVPSKVLGGGTGDPPGASGMVSFDFDHFKQYSFLRSRDGDMRNAQSHGLAPFPSLGSFGAIGTLPSQHWMYQMDPPPAHPCHGAGPSIVPRADGGTVKSSDFFNKFITTPPGSIDLHLTNGPSLRPWAMSSPALVSESHQKSNQYVSQSAPGAMSERSFVLHAPLHTGASGVAASRGSTGVDHRDSNVQHGRAFGGKSQVIAEAARELGQRSTGKGPLPLLRKPWETFKATASGDDELILPPHPKTDGTAKAQEGGNATSSLKRKMVPLVLRVSHDEEDNTRNDLSIRNGAKLKAADLATDRWAGLAPDLCVVSGSATVDSASWKSRSPGTRVKTTGSSAGVQSPCNGTPSGSRRDLRCDRCDQVFGRQSNLTRHIAMVHERLRPFTCEICEQSFGTESNLRRHKQSKHSENPKPFRCLVCEKVFGQQSDLRRHVESVHAKL